MVLGCELFVSSIAAIVGGGVERATTRRALHHSGGGVVVVRSHLGRGRVRTGGTLRENLTDWRDFAGRLSDVKRLSLGGL